MIINLSKIDFASTGGNCPPAIELQNKDYNITQNGDTVITPDAGFGGISGGTISVNVPTSSSSADVVEYGLKFSGTGFTEVSDAFTGWENLTNSTNMFSGCTKLSSWNKPLPMLTNGRSMFEDCSRLTSWDIELPKLTSGSYMFNGCSSLTSFTSDLSSLTYGNYMFTDCSLANFSIDLPNLTFSSFMFSNNNLTSWDIELPKLTNGNNMFYQCSNLTSWDIELPNLTGGSYMFQYCSGLTSFTSDLSSLISGNSMFSGCKALTNVTLTGTLNCNNLSFSASTALTVDSLVNIISVLVDRTDQSSYTLNLGSTNLAKLTDEQKAVATNKNWILN